MSESPLVTEYINRLGKIKYQPTLPSGKRLYVFANIMPPEWLLPEYETRYHVPVLFKSKKKKAKRVTKRELLSEYHVR